MQRTALLLACLLGLAVGSLACVRHTDCASTDYCDKTGQCFGCAEFCLKVNDAIDGCCPCNSSSTCVPATSPVADDGKSRLFQFSFSDDYANVDDSKLFLEALQAFLQTRLQAAGLQALDVYPGSNINVVIATTTTAADLLRTLLYRNILDFVYNDAQLTGNSGSVTQLQDASSDAQNSDGGSDSSILVPVVIVVGVVIVALICGAIVIFFRARRLQHDLAEIQMNGYDEAAQEGEEGTHARDQNFDLQEEQEDHV